MSEVFGGGSDVVFSGNFGGTSGAESSHLGGASAYSLPERSASGSRDAAKDSELDGGSVFTSPHVSSVHIEGVADRSSPYSYRMNSASKEEDGIGPEGIRERLSSSGLPPSILVKPSSACGGTSSGEGAEAALEEARGGGPGGIRERLSSPGLLPLFPLGSASESFVASTGNF